METVRRSRRRNAEPAALFRETAEIQQRTLGPDHRSTLVTLYNLACALATAHKPDEPFLCSMMLWIRASQASTICNEFRGDARFKAIIEQVGRYPETGLEEIRRERNSAVPHFS
jgi:hypothetical protein